MTKPTICAVMSTYNGEKYISTQLDSLLSQKEVNLKVYIRDDGSNDGTIAILEQYRQRHENIYIEKGCNVGLNKSFWIASRNAVSMFGTDYYAFCDQDDEWQEEKLITGIRALNNSDEIPELYYSNLQICDQLLRIRGMMYEKGCVKSTYQQALAQIFCWGCTCVFNKKAAEMYGREYYDFSHDCWLFYICMFCGKTFYDDNSLIHYRRHGFNYGNQGKPINGDDYSKLKMIIDKVVHVHDMKPSFSMMCRAICKEFGKELNQGAYRYLTVVGYYKDNLGSKIRLLFTDFIATNGLSKNITIKMRILLNKW